MAEVQYQVGFLQAEGIGLGVAPLLEHLVANAPDEDGGMVAVAHDEVGEVTFVPLVEVAGIVVGSLLLAPHVKGFIHDDEAHAVAQVEQFGGRRVVRAADAVAPHILQYLQLPLDGTRVDRRAQATQVVVHTHAVYLDVLPVKEEALLGIELKGTDAEGRVVNIGHLAVGKHRGAHIVQVGMFDAPKHGIVKGKFLPVSACAWGCTSRDAAGACATTRPSASTSSVRSTRVAGEDWQLSTVVRTVRRAWFLVTSSAVT